MPNPNIAHRRLHNQRIAGDKFQKPSDVVQWLGAVQSQDYAGAKWALAQRMRDANDAALDQAFNTGDIVRTHVMRPTWHFVHPADIRWLLALTAPRVHTLNSTMYRKLELDEALLKRSAKALTTALQGGKHLERTQLGAALAKAGIVADGMRLGYIVHWAELQALVCSGPRRGKQFTYALLEERVPQTKPMMRDEALAELVKRYFASHGPATLHDFSWWSGLTLADARAGVASLGAQLAHEVIDGQTYWFAPSASAPFTKDKSPTVYLLPNYDEYISYRDRGAVFDSQYADRLDPQAGGLPHFIVIDGRIAGAWRRTFSKGSVVIESRPFVPLTVAENKAFVATAERFGEFLDMPVTLR
jgi:hypothetical protein